MSVLVITSAILVDTGCNRQAAPPLFTPHPHPIIIIDIDTLRADRLGCYGNARDTSPTLDRFAEESIFFEWAFSQAPNTGPSQTTILSGLYPTTHGMILDEDRVPDEATMLAEVLSNEGFRTAGFHDGGYLSDDFNIGQGFNHYQNNRGTGYAATIPDAIEWLRANADSPFLLLLHTYDTHTPYDPKEPYRSMFLDGLEAPSNGFEPSVEIMERARLSQYTENPIVFPDNDIEWAKALYDAEIRYVDDWVARLLEEIRALGLDQRASIVVLSDHGEEFQEHGTVLHEKIYRTVTHIPLMIRLPGGVGARRIERVVGSVDIMPTLLDLVGAPIPSTVQGRSLLPLILGVEDGGSGGTTFSENAYFGVRRAVFHGDDHLLFTEKDSTIELFEFKSDPAEQHDTARQRADDVSRLKSMIDDWETSTHPLASPSDHSQDLDSATEEQLRALGYVE